MNVKLTILVVLLTLTACSPRPNTYGGYPISYGGTWDMCGTISLEPGHVLWGYDPINGLPPKIGVNDLGLQGKSGLCPVILPVGATFDNSRSPEMINVSNALLMSNEGNSAHFTYQLDGHDVEVYVDVQPGLHVGMKYDLMINMTRYDVTWGLPTIMDLAHFDPHIVIVGQASAIALSQ